MIIQAFEGHLPLLAPDVLLAQGVQLIGKVHLGARCGVQSGAVLRADCGSIDVGANSMIMDLCSIHPDDEGSCTIGKNVFIGRGAVIAKSTIEDGVKVGEGSLIMPGAVIGEQSILAPGVLVRRGMKIPPRSYVRGRPAKVSHELKESEYSRGAEACQRERALLERYNNQQNEEQMASHLTEITNFRFNTFLNK
ncbi:MAG: gamma carbonic anhydrase family protein [Polyangiaceae bacterium]|nr:gamma carbonic anhydrase family protein [Polyangiaceae bacterium]